MGGWVEFCFQAQVQLTGAKNHSLIKLIDFIAA